MKEIKAFVRRDRADLIIEALQYTNIPGITVTEVHPVESGNKPNYFENNPADNLDNYPRFAIVKMEIICEAGDLERFLEIIQRLADTGAQGNNMIFVSETINVNLIQEGKGNERILQLNRDQ
ncbi:MAG TPA: P-II family nitrogen regulator [Pyrinomonadaceae bacterium]|nr:P-II family nitrogen regulator [Pyrinomonadaceae bacterium]